MLDLLYFIIAFLAYCISKTFFKEGITPCITLIKKAQTEKYICVISCVVLHIYLQGYGGNITNPFYAKRDA